MDIIEKYIKNNNILNVINNLGLRPFKITMNEENMEDLIIKDNDISKFLIKMTQTSRITRGEEIYIHILNLILKNEFNKVTIKEHYKIEDEYIKNIIKLIISDYNKYYLDDKYYNAFWFDGFPYTDETMENIVKDECNIVKSIKEIINSELLKDKYKDINKDVFIIIENIIEQNPDFFILIEEILLEIVKDNKINITFLNYTQVFNKFLKLFQIFNSIVLNEFNDLLTMANFVDLIKFIILVTYDNQPKYDELIIKINDSIKSISETLNIFSNM
jgi:hypothetical protein